MNDRSPCERLRTALEKRDLDQALPFLVLGSRRTSGKVFGGKYPIDDTMAPLLRDAAKIAKTRASVATMSDYDGLTVLDSEEGLWVPAERLRDEAPLLKFLETVDDLEPLTAKQVWSKAFSFYAIGFGPDDGRIFFVREKARHIVATSKILGFIEASLRPVESPILALDTTIDFIVMDEGAVVFGSAAFERFIQEPSEIAGHFDSSMDDIARRVPFDPAVLAHIKDKGRRSTLVRGRVRSLMSRPYFANLTVERIREKLASKGLDPARFVHEERLRFAEEDTMLVLKLLDQKVWQGDFDDALYSTSAAIPEKR